MAEGKKADAEAFLKQAKIDLSDVPEGYRLLGDFISPMAIWIRPRRNSSLYSDHPKNAQVKNETTFSFDFEKPSR